MAFIDRRNKTHVYKDGSSLIAVGLTAEQATAAIGAAVAGWYGLGYMAGGNLGRDTDAQKVRDEAGDVIGTTANTDDFVITNTTQQTDATSLKLYKWLENNAVPVRYILPTPDPNVVQVHYHPSMMKDEGSDQISTQKGVRTMQFTLRGDDAGHAFADVGTDQANWATTDVADAVDTTFAAAAAV